VSVRWLLAALVAPGVVVLVVSLLPAGSLLQLAERMEHGEDLTAQRITRLRLVSVGLGAAHLLLAGWLFFIDPSQTARVLSDLRGELGLVRPIRALDRARRTLSEQGLGHALALVLVISVGAGIRLRYLNVPIDYDEAYSFRNFASRPLYQGLSDYSTTNNHLLNTLCMHVAYKLFGQREWALRWHVFAAGVLLIPAAYALARAMCGPAIALAAAAMAASSDVLINYSVNARGYIWVALMTMLLMHASWRLGSRNGTTGLAWIAAWLAAVAGGFAAPIMIYAVGGCFGWLIVGFLREGPSGRARVAGLVLWAMLVALAWVWLYAPGLVFSGVEAWRHPFVSPLSLADWYARQHVVWSMAVESWTNSLLPSPAAAALCALGILTLMSVREYHRAVSLLIAVLASTWLLMAIQRVAPPPRIFSFLAPVFFVLVAAGVMGPVSLALALICAKHRTSSVGPIRVVSSLVACVLCAVGVYRAVRDPLPGGTRPVLLIEDVAQRMVGTKPVKRSEDQLWRMSVLRAAAELASELRPGDRVLVALPADLPFHYYAAKHGLAAEIGGTPQRGQRLFLIIRRDREPRTELEENLSLREWVVSAPWLLQTDWQVWRQAGVLTLWQGRPSAEPSTK
jgi:hypothetical protein